MANVTILMSDMHNVYIYVINILLLLQNKQSNTICCWDKKKSAKNGGSANKECTEL